MKRKNAKGQSVHVWVKTAVRNEALDCRIGNRACAAFIGIDRFKENDWENLKGHTVSKPQPKDNDQEKSQTKSVMKPQQQNNFWNNQGTKKPFW